jgi:hypothetical protein
MCVHRNHPRVSNISFPFRPPGTRETTGEEQANRTETQRRAVRVSTQPPLFPCRGKTKASRAVRHTMNLSPAPRASIKTSRGRKHSTPPHFVSGKQPPSEDPRRSLLWTLFYVVVDVSCFVSCSLLQQQRRLRQSKKKASWPPSTSSNPSRLAAAGSR